MFIIGMCICCSMHLLSGLHTDVSSTYEGAKDLSPPEAAVCVDRGLLLRIARGHAAVTHAGMHAAQHRFVSIIWVVNIPGNGTPRSVVGTV